MTKQELQEENDGLRDALEDARDLIDEVLDGDDGEGQDGDEDQDGE